MAYIGNKDGPRESVIVEHLGHEYFGITPAQLAEEVACYRDEEMRGEVGPVQRDEDGRHYLLFSGPGGKQKKFYLEEHGYVLTGTIETQPTTA